MWIWPAGAAGGEAGFAWYEDVRDAWLRTLRAATRLAERSADFRRAARARASIWTEGGGPGDLRVPELDELRAAVYR